MPYSNNDTISIGFGGEPLPEDPNETLIPPPRNGTFDDVTGLDPRETFILRNTRGDELENSGSSETPQSTEVMTFDNPFTFHNPWSSNKTGDILIEEDLLKFATGISGPQSPQTELFPAPAAVDSIAGFDQPTEAFS